MPGRAPVEAPRAAGEGRTAPSTLRPPIPKLHLGPVYFDRDNARLTGDARAELQRAGYLLNAYPDLQVLLTGYADEREAEEDNLALGAERAQTCRRYLNRLGVDADRIRTRSQGEAGSATADRGELDRPRSRRVEFELSR